MLPSAHLFAYGTLELAAVLERVTGASFRSQAAVLPGFARYRLAAQPYPAIIFDREQSVTGTLYFDLQADAFARLDAYESDIYERFELGVTVGNVALAAQCYVLRPECQHLLSSAAWDREEFEQNQLAAYLARL